MIMMQKLALQVLDTRIFRGYNLLLKASTNVHGYVELSELSADPANPATDKARIYCKNNGGKTELYVIFQTGSGVLIRAEA